MKRVGRLKGAWNSLLSILAAGQISDFSPGFGAGRRFLDCTGRFYTVSGLIDQYIRSKDGELCAGWRFATTPPHLSVGADGAGDLLGHNKKRKPPFSACKRANLRSFCILRPWRNKRGRRRGASGPREPHHPRAQSELDLCRLHGPDDSLCGL